MSVAWPDEDYAETGKFQEEAQAAALEESSDWSSSRCGAILAWLRASEDRGHALGRDVPTAYRIIWPTSPEPGSFEGYSYPGQLWKVLARLDSAIGELDEEPAPTGQDADIVAYRLQDLAARLTRLEKALPDEADFYESDESKQQVVVDWRAINRDQASGLPARLVSEDGARLDKGRRIQLFDVSALEDEETESLVE